MAGDDSEVYQLLLSHIKRHEMDLRERTLLSHLPELSAKFADHLGDAHETFSYIIGVGHQSVEVRLNGDSTDIFTGDWREKTFASYSQTSNYQKKTESFESLWILVCVIWVLVMIFSALD